MSSWLWASGWRKSQALYHDTHPLPVHHCWWSPPQLSVCLNWGIPSKIALKMINHDKHHRFWVVPLIFSEPCSASSAVAPRSSSTTCVRSSLGWIWMEAAVGWSSFWSAFFRRLKEQSNNWLKTVYILVDDCRWNSSFARSQVKTIKFWVNISHERLGIHPMYFQ